MKQLPNQKSVQEFARESEQDMAASENFAGLVQEHSRLLYRIAMAVTRNRQDAEDAVQEAFLQLYRTANWQQIDDHRAYLARIAWRTAIRKRKLQDASNNDNMTQQAEPRTEPKSQEASPEDQAIDRQMEQAMHRLIDQLPEKLRQPLALSGLGELSQVEIAKVLGLPEGTVRRRIHTARQKLRAQWQQQRGTRS